MRKEKNRERDNSQGRSLITYALTIPVALTVLIAAVFLPGCTKYQYGPAASDILTAAGIEEIIPADLADSVVVNPVVEVTFKSGTDPSKISASTLSLNQGNTSVPGSVSVSGTTIKFTSSADLASQSEFTATLKTTRQKSSGSEEPFEYSWKFKTGKHHNDDHLSVVSVDPADLATEVPVTTSLKVTLSKEVKQEMNSLISVTMKAGSKSVAGSLSFAGNLVTFKPTENLTPGTNYSCEFVYGGNNEGDHDEEDDKSDISYSWSFTTAGNGNDVTPPAVNSAEPANNATSVPVTTAVSITFSEPMDPVTVTAATFTLKQGTVIVSGSLSSTGNSAKFTPSAALAANTVYSGTVTTGVKDIAGNALAADYAWSFTTADLIDATPPTVLSVVPSSNDASVALDSKVMATFSEPMNSGTITSSTFTLKQGNTSVNGTVTYSGTVATFTPSASLTGGTTYTATITTGVKDVTGNALAAIYTWNFTTVTATTAMSFAGDVIPVLTKCNNCHNHPWTVSSNTTTYYNNLVNGSFVKPASPTTSKIYDKLNGGHASPTISSADINKILTWMNEGSKNN